PCRIYAPVGSHETLLAYLVRRLLENGANTSFVQRIADPGQSIESLVADPVSTVEATAAIEGQVGLPHPRIPLPRNLYPDRLNSLGLDLDDERCLASIGRALARAGERWTAHPMLSGQTTDGSSPDESVSGASASGANRSGEWRLVRNPACREDAVGGVRDA